MSGRFQRETADHALAVAPPEEVQELGVGTDTYVRASCRCLQTVGWHAACGGALPIVSLSGICGSSEARRVRMKLGFVPANYGLRRRERCAATPGSGCHSVSIHSSCVRAIERGSVPGSAKQVYGRRGLSLTATAGSTTVLALIHASEFRSRDAREGIVLPHPVNLRLPGASVAQRLPRTSSARANVCAKCPCGPVTGLLS